MTENEAIKVFKELLDVPCEMLVKYDSVTTEEQKKALVRIRVAEDMAIQSLEEIQQYREIGTIEEFKVLKEKNEPKKITGIRFTEAICPKCESELFETYWAFGGIHYCATCGQKIDWQ